MKIISRLAILFHTSLLLSCMTLKPPLNDDELKKFVTQRPESKGIVAIKFNIKAKLLFSSQLLIADFKNLQTSETLSFKKGFDNEKLEAGLTGIMMFPLPEGTWKLESLILRRPAGSYEGQGYWESNTNLKISELLPNFSIEKNDLFQLCQLDVTASHSLNSSGKLVLSPDSKAACLLVKPKKEDYKLFASSLELSRVKYPFLDGSKLAFISTKEW